MKNFNMMFEEGAFGNLDVDSIATLADEPTGLTCSVKAAREWGGEGDTPYIIRGYSSFEEASETVVEGVNDSLLVAGAYPNIGRFFYHPDLIAMQAQIVQLPDFVLAFPDEVRSEVETLYHHAATETLRDKAHLKYALARTALTNSEVARLARDDPDSATITNLLCANHYRLTVGETLAKGQLQTFTLFGRAPQ